jgi:hypothetical protein
MAERPVFVPSTTGSQLVQEVQVRFPWHPGLAPSQKKKNVFELHHAALARGLGPLLEISSKSELEADKSSALSISKLRRKAKRQQSSARFRAARYLSPVVRFPIYFGKRAKKRKEIRGSENPVG